MDSSVVLPPPDFLLNNQDRSPAPVLQNPAPDLLKRILDVTTQPSMPTPGDKSAAVKFMEEYEKAQRDLMLLVDENTSLKSEVAQRQNMIDLLTNENMQNKAKADLYMRYAATIAAQIHFVNDGLTQALKTAKDVTLAAQSAGLDMELTDDDKQSLGTMFGTLPANKL